MRKIRNKKYSIIYGKLFEGKMSTRVMEILASDLIDAQEQVKLLTYAITVRPNIVYSPYNN